MLKGIYSLLKYIGKIEVSTASFITIHETKIPTKLKREI